MVIFTSKSDNKLHNKDLALGFGKLLKKKLRGIIFFLSNINNR